jgi:hypothetical protein
VASSLLFIPDISGFSDFVNRTEVSHSQHVVAELLELIIDSDELGLTVSEVEGDAVLFHKKGEVPPLDAIVHQASLLFQAFHARLRDFETRRICDCGACSTAHTLSLKIIAHSGPIEILEVKRFQKPFGPEVILAHRLLKNDLESHEYLLVTGAMLEAQGVEADGSMPDAASPPWGDWATGSSTYDDLGPVPYRYLSLSPLLERIPEPPLPTAATRSKNPLIRDTFVNRPLPELFELVSNFDSRLLWNTSVDDLRYEADRLNRVGTRHQCVIGGDLIEFETVTDDFGEGRVAYGERLLDPPLVKELSVFYVMETEGDGTRLRMEVHYLPRAFPGSLLAPFFRFSFGRRLPVTLKAIKEVAESTGSHHPQGPYQPG